MIPYANFLSETLIIIHSYNFSIFPWIKVQYINTMPKSHIIHHKLQTFWIVGRFQFPPIFAAKVIKQNSKWADKGIIRKIIEIIISLFTVISLPLQVILGLCCIRFYIEHTETNRQLKRAMNNVFYNRELTL